MQQQTLVLLIGSPGAAGNLLHILTSNDFVLSAGTVEVSHGQGQITPWGCFPGGGRDGQRFGSAFGAGPVHYVTTQGDFYLSA